MILHTVQCEAMWGSQHRTAALRGSAHSGSRHFSYASPHGSRHGKDTGAPRDVATAGGSSGGLYATNGHVSPAAKAAAGDQAV